jgi:hypothetical protein
MRTQRRIYWETRNETAPDAGTFVVHLHSGDSGRILSTPLRRSGVGKGVVLVTEPPRPNFYLSFEASNLEWSVRVEEPVAAKRTSLPSLGRRGSSAWGRRTPRSRRAPG